LAFLNWMSEVVLFNHIPKTAGSTMKQVLWRVAGGDRVLFATTIGSHRQAIEAIIETIDHPLDTPYAVVAHTGFGVEEHLPARHTYRKYTVLRDPVQRTLSEFFYARDDQGDLPAGISLKEFLAEETLRSFNSQTAFLAGLTVGHHLEGVPLERSQFDQDLLERAKSNLESHDVIGLTEHFDEALLLLRDAYGWPLSRTLYRRANVGAARRASPLLSEAELDLVRSSNELDIELYRYAQELFWWRLGTRAPDHAAQIRRFRRLNGIYGRTYPLAYPPAKAVVQSFRRVSGTFTAKL
jgi:hypothetical protein